MILQSVLVYNCIVSSVAVHNEWCYMMIYCVLRLSGLTQCDFLCEYSDLPVSVVLQQLIISKVIFVKETTTFVQLHELNIVSFSLFRMHSLNWI